VDADTEQFIHRFYAVFAAGDLGGLKDFLAEDAEFVNPPEAVEGGTRRGRESALESARSLHDQFRYESAEIVEVTEGPNGILVGIRFVLEGRGSGVRMDETFNHVLRLRDGRVTRLAWFSAREDAAAEAGA
jgi:ketosteroid isomerase-like protein